MEAGNFGYIKKIISRDYQTWSGRLLEQFFYDLFTAMGKYNQIGSYWEKGNQNEIDLVAVNDIEKTITQAEIKLNKDRINLNILREKSRKLLAGYRHYQPKWLALGIEDIPSLLNELHRDR